MSDEGAMYDLRTNSMRTVRFLNDPTAVARDKVRSHTVTTITDYSNGDPNITYWDPSDPDSKFLDALLSFYYAVFRLFFPKDSAFNLMYGSDNSDLVVA